MKRWLLLLAMAAGVGTVSAAGRAAARAVRENRSVRDLALSSR